MATVLVTGVGRRRGIGAGIAAGLAEDGWNLALSYWHPYDQRLGLEGSPDDPQLLADELRSQDRRVELIEVDLEDPAGAATLVDTAVQRLGQLDALVMSHCESVDSGVLDTTVESFDRHYAVNVRASWLLIAAFAQQLSPAGGAALALTSDHTVENLPYGVTREHWTGWCWRPLTSWADWAYAPTSSTLDPLTPGWMDDAVRAAGLAQQPTGRLGTPRDTADLVRFLLSDRGAWINGQLLHSNGGYPKGHLPT